MSETSRKWQFYVLDMIRFAERALGYTERLTQPQLLDSALTYDATVRNRELLGEAATRLPEQARRVHDEIPWRLIIATRNRLIHGYLGIDDDTLWSIMTEDLPALLPRRQILAGQIRARER
ncbi:MAG: HepT-like ribonuclease domain-containing protein [Steroidobacteraceae bacterium]